MRRVPTSSEPFGLGGARHAMAAMAAEGNDMIVDEVLMDGAAEYAALLAPFRVHWVGVHAPLAVLDAREQARGDREIGLARWQFDKVPEGVRYDLELVTSRSTPADCARAIKARFAL